MARDNGKPLNVVGKPFRKVDARAKCTGQTKFADDIFLPRMLYCKILRSHEPHALIKNIDLSKALEVPGVIDTLKSSTEILITQVQTGGGKWWKKILG